MVATALVAGYAALLGLVLVGRVGYRARTLTRWLRTRWLLVAWDVPLTRHWEPRCWPGAWSTATSRWVRL